MNEEILDGESAESSNSQSKLLLVAIVGVALAAFVVQNTDSADVSWLVFERSAPLWIVILASAGAGAVLSELVGWVLRRRRRSG